MKEYPNQFYPAPPPGATHVCYVCWGWQYTPTYHRTVIRTFHFKIVEGPSQDYPVTQTFCKDAQLDWVTWFGGKGRWIDGHSFQRRFLERIPRVPFIGAIYQNPRTPSE